MRALAIVAAAACVCATLAGVLHTGELYAQTDEVARPDAANQVERNVVEYKSNRLHIVAAQHYSWGDHDPRWLLIDIGIQVRSGGALTVARRDFSIVRPDGVKVPLTSQRDYRRARAELLPLHLQLHTLAVDPVGGYFPGGRCPDHQFRFFVDSGIRQTVVYANRVGPCVRGDLFFASPDRGVGEGHLHPGHRRRYGRTAANRDRVTPSSRTVAQPPGSGRRCRQGMTRNAASTSRHAGFALHRLTVH